MATMKEFAREGKSILFISHKLNEIMEVSDRVSVLRKGKYIGTVNTSETTKQELSNMMVGRPVQLEVTKDEAKPAGEVLKVDHLCVHSHVQKRNAVNDVSFNVRAGDMCSPRWRMEAWEISLPQRVIVPEDGLSRPVRP